MSLIYCFFISPHKFSITILWRELSTSIIWEMQCNWKIQWISNFFNLLNTLPSIPLTLNALIVLATWWSSSRCLLSQVSLVTLLLLPVVLNWNRTFTFPGYFDLEEEAGITWCHIQWIKWMRTHRTVFIWWKLPSVVDQCGVIKNDGECSIYI